MTNSQQRVSSASFPTEHSPYTLARICASSESSLSGQRTTTRHPQSAGLYLGQSAQYCGTQHAKMLLRVYADSPADFAAWVASQQRPAVDDPSVAAGLAVFQHNACISCHTVAGTVATGKFGPDLT